MVYKILVPSDTPWNTNNSFGNSYANIFDDLEGYEIANIYCKEGVVNDFRVSRAYKVTARMLLRGMCDHFYIPGEETMVEDIKGDRAEFSKSENAIITFGKKHRFQIFFWVYGWIWRWGNWNNEKLKCFLEEFKPDMIFCPIYPFPYINRMILELKKQTGVPVLGYISDDNYTLRMFHPSPFFWLNRLIQRRWVKRVIDACDILYVISDIQKKEYDKIFNRDSYILTKGKDFTVAPPKAIPSHEPPYRIVYAGNIGGARWKTLSKIINVMKEINKDRTFFKLDIYTATPLTNKMAKKLNVLGTAEVKGKIPYKEVAQKQAEADILLHAAPTDIIHRWEEHHGFSTKLVDYMASNRAILSYGFNDQAAVEYLRKQNVAFVASSPQELTGILKKIIANPGMIHEYGMKAWHCGVRNHDIKNFHNMLRKNFESVLGKGDESSIMAKRRQESGQSS